VLAPVKQKDLPVSLPFGFGLIVTPAERISLIRFLFALSPSQKARARIAAHSDRYVNHIYGLEEVGGTSVLLLSSVPLDTLGYATNLSKDPLPLLTWNVLQKIPNFVMFGAVLLSGIWWITNRRIEVAAVEKAENEKKSHHKAENDEVS